MSYRLTEYSHGAGCGCKLSPGVLEDILQSGPVIPEFERLLVGHDTRDDAAVVDLDGQTAIVSTTDFFMPIVDDAFDFGAIAATNAISDIYAMGAEPIVAIAILGWPIDKLPASLAAEVLAGGRKVCANAGIPLAGGHSIDSPEPIFGLAVTGKVLIDNLKKNKDGRPGDLLYLTKPLGIGIVTTAQKKKLATEADLAIVKASMLQLNSIGTELAGLPYVHALTDVTGFGLGGHLVEVCEASNTSAVIRERDLPRFSFVHNYIELGCIPGGTGRNWKTYGHLIGWKEDASKLLIADPQTSGGLLVSISPDHRETFETLLSSKQVPAHPIGQLAKRNGDILIEIK
jgi:selenide,water dikinase